MIIVEGVSKDYSIFQDNKDIKNPIKRFFKRDIKSIRAVDDVSFEIHDTSIVGLIGLNGAGKTTTLKMLSGLIKPTKGTVTINGFEPWLREHAYLREIAFFMGNKNQLLWDVTAMESYLLESEIYGISHEEFKSTLSGLIQLLDVEELLNVPVRKLSLGQRMKMELILSLLHKPKVLFLDEPTIGLDIITQNKIREFLIDYRSRENATIIITSHNMRDIENVCDKIIVMDKGRLIFDDRISTLKKRYDNEILVEVKFSDSESVDKALLEIKGFNYTLRERGIDRLRIKINILDKEIIKNKLLEVDSVEKFFYESMSFEDILSTMIRGDI